MVKLRFRAKTVKLQFPAAAGGKEPAHKPPKNFAILQGLHQAEGMIPHPLALVLYERILPGSQLVNRLQDLNYRVECLAEPGRLVECAEQLRPMVVLADLEPAQEGVCAALAQLKQHAATKHLPIIAFGAEPTPGLETAAQQAGVNLVVSDTAVLNHLPQLLERALHLE